MAVDRTAPGGRYSSARAHRPPMEGLALRGGALAGRPRKAPERKPAASGAPRPTRDNPLRRLFERLRRAWDRPLTAYYVILGASLLIIVLGLVMVYSASVITALNYGLSGSFFFRKQLTAAVLGGVLLVIAARMPVTLHRALSYPLLVGSIAAMALVQVPGIGHEINGNQNWISLGFFQVQPSEFGKLALVLWGADLLARKGEKRLLNQWKHMLVPLVPVTFVLLGLIMIGGDMGTAMILTAVLFGLLWLAGAPTRMFAGVLTFVSLLGVVLIKTSANRMARFACLGSTDPTAFGDKCQQGVHGLYALASGGLFGSGLGASVEKWGQLPEAHTDFIFAVTGEELGLAGTLSVLGLFAALGYAGIRVAGRTEDPFVRYAAGGVITWITAQAVINLGAVLGLLPIAGVPLPLFSYGGSALLPTMFAIGLLIAFARDEPAARAALARRGPGFGRKRFAVRWNTMRRRASSARTSGER